jgi:large subunit ribosomal protein L21
MEDMYAVIETGGKQYTVRKNDLIEVEMLKDVDVGGAVEFSKVLLLNQGGDQVKIGAPSVNGCIVRAILRDPAVKQKKVRGMKREARGTSKKKTFGHRQKMACVEIVGIDCK